MEGEKCRPFMSQMPINELMGSSHSKGFKGYCATSEAIKERLGLSDKDLKRHYELFAIDEYIVQPDPDKRVSCSRDAIRVIKEKLETALK